MNKIILKQDSRDVHVLDHFGTPATIPLEIDFDKNLTNPIEKAGDVDCTAIDSSDVCTNQTGVIYDTNDLWNLTPKTGNGADPRDSMSIVINQGLLPIGGQIRDKRWSSYMRAEGNSGDYFATAQASMTSLNSPSMTNTNWYLEWDYVGPDGVLPEGKTWVSGHSYEVTGWTLKGSEMCFHVKHWLGYMVWMPKSVYNEEMNKYGTCALIPTTQIALKVGEKTLMQWLSDLIVNIGLSFQQTVLNVLPASGFPPTTNPTDKIRIWCNAIALEEGANQSLNNPGDLKVSTLTKSWGATLGFQASDGGYIAKFSNITLGFQALYNFLKLGCENELISFHQSRTLSEFMKVYAGNPPQGYIDGVIAYLNRNGVVCTANTDVSTFVS